MKRGSVSAADLAALLDHWVAAGIISGEQAERMRDDAAPAPRRPDRSGSLVAEAIGYLGGVIVVVGLVLVVGRFWADLGVMVRVGLAGAIAGLLVAAGAVVPARAGAAGVRLRSVIWLGAPIAVYAGLALFAADRLGWNGNQQLVLGGGGAVAVSAVLWALHRRSPQLAVLYVFLLLTVAAWTAMHIDSVMVEGAVVWLIGAILVTLGEFSLVPPPRTARILGTVTVIIGSVWVEQRVWGTVLALVSVVALVSVAVVTRDLVLLSVASAGTLIVAPVMVLRYFPGVLSAALTLVTAGLLLVGLAVLTARRRPRIAAES
jgi:hypothetical protein